LEAAAIRNRRTWILIAVVFAPLAALPFLPPVGQDPHYHAFADARGFFGVPNFLNVASNAPFLAIGIAGIALCLSRRLHGAALSWLVFFAGVTLVTFGSGGYHWDPRDPTLVWDRIPMTIGFMALFVALLTEHGAATGERRLLAVAIAVGIASVAWWRLSGDLKLYGWVQFSPFVAIVALLVLYPRPYTGRYWLAYGFAFYALAKVAEFSDARIFEATAHAISGHTLKHLLAAGAPLCIYFMLRNRRVVS
jgi:hypothetical protein